MASPAPVLLSVTVKPICSPAVTVALSAVLLIVRCGQLTVMVTDALLPLPPFCDVKLAVLVSVCVPHVAAVVGLVTWSLSVAPAARLNVPVVFGLVPQLSDWFGAVPETAHEMPLGIELPAASSDQLTPGAPGRLSVRVTPVAVPVPLFVSVTVKPI